MKSPRNERGDGLWNKINEIDETRGHRPDEAPSSPSEVSNQAERRVRMGPLVISPELAYGKESKRRGDLDDDPTLISRDPCNLI